ncbi:MAG: universal stress protein [Bacteroidetes bacterium]|nr:universal stress protein [Bacteroidota bacterium]
MDTILVPTDFSAPADNALNYAAELAKYFNAQIVLIHAYHIPAANYEMAIPPDVISSIQFAASNALEKTKARFMTTYPGLRITCLSDMGMVEDVVRDAVGKYDADVVVMGITGESGVLKEHVIGSSSVKLSRHLNIPVFIIPEKASYHKIHKVGFACDMNKTEESTLVYVVKYFGQLFDAEVDVIHVGNGKPNETTINTSHYIDEKLRSIPHHMIFIESDDTALALQKHFMDYPVDVIITIPHAQSVFHNLFSVTKKLAFHSEIPIMTIHE